MQKWLFFLLMGLMAFEVLWGKAGPYYPEDRTSQQSDSYRPQEEYLSVPTNIYLSKNDLQETEQRLEEKINRLEHSLRQKIQADITPYLNKLSELHKVREQTQTWGIITTILLGILIILSITNIAVSAARRNY